MSKRQKLKEKLYPEENEEEEEERKLKSVAAVSSDDEEANEDFSHKIVEKHLLMRAAKLDPDEDSFEGDVVLKDKENKNDSAVDLPSLSFPEIELDVTGPSGKRRIRKKKKKAENIEIGDQAGIVAKVEQKAETVENDEEVVKAAEDPTSVETLDNVVLRKLLRGPRYFDPPDSGWQTCYNCGEEGHMAVNCSSAVKRKKPCFICGSLEHSAKQCTKAHDCFICKKSGHRAKDCPEKHKIGSQNALVCLKCGDSGHDLFSCRNSYSLDDLKEIQCYICKSFAHLCCVKVADNGPKEVSCFRCGQLGHTGLACARLRIEATDASPSSCYNCGGEGHFARECDSSAKIRKRNIDLSTPTLRAHREICFTACARLRVETTNASPSSCYKCGGEGHFARECVSFAEIRKRNIDLSMPTLRPHRENKDYSGHKSVPHDLGKARKKKKTQHDERCLTTPWKSKQRGGWIVDDPGDVSCEKAKRNHRRSPGTPSSKGHKVSAVTSSGHISSSQPSKKKSSHHRFSASRFDNSGSDGIRRNYDWR